MSLTRGFSLSAALSGVALAASAFTFGTAQAADPDYHTPPPYVGAQGVYVFPDSDRSVDHGYGPRFVFGIPLKAGPILELNGLWLREPRENANGKDSAWSAGLDFLFPLTTGNVRPFLLLGGGYFKERVSGNWGDNGYANAGAGLLFKINDRLDARLEGRYVGQFTDRGAPAGSDPLYDTQVGLGLQVALGDTKPRVKDDDGDGVPNDADQCPNTPAGVAVNAQGCPLDSDGDGVPDISDKCPNTPRGTAVNAQGCPLDSDGDGVVDNLDRCPNTPRGVQVNADGCPLDSDRDGVPDHADRCPNTPAGLRVDANGCVVREKQTIVLQNVNFEFNKATLTPDSRSTLDAVANGLKSQRDLYVEIAGHTDSVGSDAYNKKLSQARADSVRSYLITQGGVPAAQLTARGYGESNPSATNDTEEGRAQNRRVEFRVLSK